MLLASAASGRATRQHPHREMGQGESYVRRTSKATTAGSTKRLGKKSKPALLLCVLAASVATLALVVGSASGATTRFLVETFGSSAQPTFPGDRGMAVDQA